MLSCGFKNGDDLRHVDGKASYSQSPTILLSKVFFASVITMGKFAMILASIQGQQSCISIQMVSAYASGG